MIGNLFNAIFKVCFAIIGFVIINMIGIVVCSKFLFEPIMLK